MSKKKYTKLLAAAWCATTMASFYAAPVYAGDLVISGVATGSDQVTVSGSSIASAIGNETIPQLTVNRLILDGVTLDSAALSKATDFTVANTLTVGDQELTAAKIQGYDQAVNDVATNKSNITTLGEKLTNVSYASGTGTTVDGVVMNNGKITATNGAVIYNGATINGVLGVNGNATVSGTLISNGGLGAGTNGTEFTVNPDGSVSAASGKFSVSGDGTMSVDSNKFSVAGSTGNTNVGGTLYVSGQTALNDKLTVNKNGAAITGDTTIKGAFTAGSNEEFKVETGNVIAKGQLSITDSTGTESESLTIGKIKEYNKTVTNTGGIERTSGSTYYTTIEGKVKVGDDGTVLINDGDTNQIKIDADGLHVGTTSTHMATDGVYAGGTNYADAKAAIATDGKIKGAEGKFEVAADGSMKAADGNFSVDAAGNAALGGTLEVTGASTFTGKLTANNGAEINNGLTVNGATTLNDKLTVTSGGAAITGDTTIKGALGAGANGTEFSVDAAGKVVAKGGLSVGDAEQFTVDAATGNIVSKGSITAANGGNIGGVTFDNAKNVSGISSLTATTITTDTLNVASFNSTGNMSVGGNLTVTGTINGAAINNTQFNGVILEGGNVSATDVNASNVNATGTIQGATIKADDNNILTSAGIKATAGSIGGVTLTGNKVSSTDAAFTNVDASKITLNDTVITDGSISDATGMNINGVNILGGNINTNGDVTAKNATLESATIGTNTIIKSTGIESNKITLGDTFITDGVISDADGMSINDVHMQGGKLTAANGVVVDANNALNSSGLTATQGTFADSVTVGAAGTQTTIGGGEATFSKGANDQTVIDGGTITANKLKVDEIVLGKDADGSGDQDIIIGADGKFSAAGGNFAIVGGNGTDRGALTNIVGGTKFKTTADGAEFSHKNAAGNVSGLTIGDNNVALGVQNNGGVDINATSTNVHSGNAGMIVEDNSLVNKVGTDVRTEMDNNSITDTVGSTSSTMTQDSITDKVGDTTVKTENGNFSVSGSTGNGMSIDTNSGKVTFKGNSTPVVSGGATNTTIDGNTITTGHLITDKLTIKGQGSAGGDGQIALGGDGSIESNIKDGDKETTFKTDANGIKAQAQDKATGSGSTLDVNSNQISAGVGTTDKHASQFLTGEFASTNVQNTTTGETSEHVQEAGKITDKVTDGNGKTSERVQTSSSITDKLNGGFVEVALDEDSITQKAGEGKVEITNDAITNTVGYNSTKLDANGFVVNHGGKDVTIANGDVTIGAAGEEIKLSELGQMKDLDAEITSREEYTNNKTAVGAINAEAGIRRQEIARLDSRIDDVSERVDKVGAMSAAIASLRTMGYDPQAPSEFAIGLGHYKGETGIAMGYFHYPSRDFMINVSLSTAGGETMGGLGATWRFGHKSPQELLEKQRAEQLKKQLQAAEKYEAAVKLAKEAQERADYAAKVAAEAQKHAEIAKADADYTESKIAE